MSLGDCVAIYKKEVKIKADGADLGCGECAAFSTDIW
jgi:hypothetical protein